MVTPSRPLNLATKSVQGPKPQDVKAAAVAASVAVANGTETKYAPRPMQRGKRLSGIDPTTAEGKAAVEDALDSYVMLQALDGGRFNFRATCCECFWQTHQQSRETAIDAVKSHAVRHLYQM
jgi:hypothetical protein